MVSDPRAARFGILVRQRRTELGLTQRQVTRRGGPAGPVISNVERAVASTISPETLAKLDTGLGWSPGSSASALTGALPLIDDAPVDGDRAQIPAGFVAVPVSAVAALLDTVQALSRLVAGDVDVTVLTDARARLRDLDATLAPIYYRYLTCVIEDHLVHNDELPTHLAVMDRLLPPTVDDDPALADDTRYRRWLTGDTAGLEPTTQTRFQERLNMRRELVTSSR